MGDCVAHRSNACLAGLLSCESMLNCQPVYIVFLVNVERLSMWKSVLTTSCHIFGFALKHRARYNLNINCGGQLA